MSLDDSKNPKNSNDFENSENLGGPGGPDDSYSVKKFRRVFKSCRMFIIYFDDL